MLESVCPGCHPSLPSEAGPTHKYVVTSPECWRVFNEAMIGTTYRLLTDAYMAQHPDGDSSQQRQSVAVHLITLTAVLARGEPVDTASRITRAGVEAGRREGGYPRLGPPSAWKSTIADVASDKTDAGSYARDVLDVWMEIEAPTLRDWTDRTLGLLYESG